MLLCVLCAGCIFFGALEHVHVFIAYNIISLQCIVPQNFDLLPFMYIWFMFVWLAFLQTARFILYLLGHIVTWQS